MTNFILQCSFEFCQYINKIKIKMFLCTNYSTIFYNQAFIKKKKIIMNQ